MKLETSTWIYEQYNLKKLNDHDLEKFWRIIQETWSFFFWEYTKCSGCWEVKSKKDIYKNFTSQYTDYTVEELEKKFNHNFICTTEWCWCDTEHIWWESFIQELEKSLTQNIHANLVTYKNKANTIVWLGYHYINTLKFLKKELEFDFSNEELNKAQLESKNKYFLLPTGLSIIEKEKKYATVTNIWTTLFKSSPSEYENLSWIFASLQWSKTHNFYIKNWAFDHWIQSHSSKDIRLLEHANIIKEYKQNISFIL
jgi:hypothetical protein